MEEFVCFVFFAVAAYEAHLIIVICTESKFQNGSIRALNVYKSATQCNNSSIFLFSPSL